MKNTTIVSTEQEIWKIHPEFTAYEVSNFGEVRNASTQKVLSHREDKDGYDSVHLRIGINTEHGKYMLIHRMVADAFMEPIEGKPYVDHIDRDRKNNKLDNLRFVDAKENAANRKKISYMLTNKVPIVLLDKKGNFVQRFENANAASEELKLSVKGIRSNVHGNKSGYSFGTFVREVDYLEQIGEQNS